MKLQQQHSNLLLHRASQAISYEGPRRPRFVLSEYEYVPRGGVSLEIVNGVGGGVGNGLGLGVGALVGAFVGCTDGDTDNEDGMSLGCTVGVVDGEVLGF